MRKVVNLADRQAVMEALKQLYGQGVKDDRENASRNRESGAASPGEVDKNAENL